MTAFPATGYGDGLTLTYAAGAQTYTVGGNGITTSFGSADLDPAAPSGSVRYRRTMPSGFVERLSFGVPSIGGAALKYAGGFSLNVMGTAGYPNFYSCSYGVPTLVTDPPTATMVSFPNVDVFGTAFVNGGSQPGNYDIRDSTATVSVDLGTGTVNIHVQLIGRLVTAGSPAATTTDLGFYDAVADIDDTKPSYYGTIGSSDRNSIFSQVGGWFYGPQGKEAMMAYTIVARNSADAETIAIGQIAAVR